MMEITEKGPDGLFGFFCPGPTATFALEFFVFPRALPSPDFFSFKWEFFFRGLEKLERRPSIRRGTPGRPVI